MPFEVSKLSITGITKIFLMEEKFKVNYGIVIINVGQKITITTINFKFLFLENYLYDSSDAQL